MCLISLSLWSLIIECIYYFLSLAFQIGDVRNSSRSSSELVYLQFPAFRLVQRAYLGSASIDHFDLSLLSEIGYRTALRYVNMSLFTR